MFNPPWTADFVPKPPSGASATMDNRRQSGLWAQNTQTGFYEQQQQQSRNPGPYRYYQAPARQSTDETRRSFSDRAGASAGTTAEAVRRSDSKHVRDSVRAASDTVAQGPLKDVLAHGGTTSGELANTQHISSVPLQTASPDMFLADNLDDVPENLRSKPWSPEPPPAKEPDDSATPVRQDSTPVRRGSVPHRSPLQKLEGHLDNISKEEKRVRMEHAENHARKRSLSGKGKSAATEEGEVQSAPVLRSEKGRVVSDGSRRASGGAPMDQRYPNPKRQASTGASVNETAESRFSHATEALRESQGESVPAPRPRTRDTLPDRHAPLQQRRLPPIAFEPNPYHHAPPAPRESGIRQEPQPYHHAPGAPRNAGVTRRATTATASTRESSDGQGVQRSASGGYGPRIRDAGYAGVAAATGVGMAVAGHEMSAADRGRAAHERRKSQNEVPRHVQSSNVGVARTESRKLQKKGFATNPSAGSYIDGDQSGRNRTEDPIDNTTSAPHQNDRLDLQHSTPGHRAAPQYKVPPQTTNGQQAREQVGFHSIQTAAAVAAVSGAGVPPGGLSSNPSQSKSHHLSNLFHRGHDHHQSIHMHGTPPLDEWRNAKVARLDLSDLEFDVSTLKNEVAKDNVTTRPSIDAPWWEKGQEQQIEKDTRSGNATGPDLASAQLDGPYEEQATMFRPQLFLKCGPLLRYTGIRREANTARTSSKETAIWRGTVMIVTEDSQSDLSSAPSLRLFAQPMDLLQHPSKEAMARGQKLTPEHEDPVAGQVKVSRTGRPLYVRSVHDIDGEVDLSREENNNGLYSATQPQLLRPQPLSSAPYLEGRDQTSPHLSFQDKSRIKRRDGEKAGKVKEVKAIRLHTERGFTFWRFSIEIELGSTERRIAYRINNGPALGFWVPGRAQSMNIMFHSCNGFSLSVNSNAFSGPDPLWRDVLNRHQSRPFHVMLGGGDQIYNDSAVRDAKLFGEWIRTKNPEHKHSTQFSPEMQDELESFYLHRYSMWFSQGLFAMAGSQIPMVNIWDDHDIIDGYGSYPHRLMASRVFTGLGAVAFKYYMLFQHQSLVAETEKEEPSWVLGASPGPYINELSRSLFLDFGPHVKFLGIDCRTERMRDEVLSQASYELLFERCEREIQKGATKHLIVLLGVPIAYPRLNFLENILTSRVLDPIKAIGRTGLLGGFVNKFDGGVEILDDLDDHWTAKHHKGERNWFIQELQEFAAEKSVRVTILGGDVHLGAVGQFYTPRKFGVSKDKDHRYMPNVISSAIVNTPPPPMMADVLNRRNKVHHLDDETDEDLIPMFEVDVDGSRRNNKCLLPRRNYCTIREFAPGSTPPGTPHFDEPVPISETRRSFSIQDESLWSAQPRNEQDRRFPPGSMRRTMSLTRSGAANLIRRFSGSRKSKNPPVSLESAQPASEFGRSNSLSGAFPGAGGSYFPPPAATERPTFMFHRRPTNLSVKEIRKAAAKGGAPPDEEHTGPPVGHIDLEGGLDISLNMEINQRDPSGQTHAYRLLVPALFYEGTGDVNTARFKAHRQSFMNRLKSVRRRKEIEDHDAQQSRSPSPTPPTPTTEFQRRVQTEGAAVARPPMNAAAQAQSPQSFGNDGVFEQRRTAGLLPARLSLDVAHTRGAYDKGYNLSAPPIGAGHYPPASAPNAADNVSYPRVSAQQQYPPITGQVYRSVQQPRPAAVYDQGDTAANSDGSLTPSEEFLPSLHEESLPQRRGSKAERFFGIGDDAMPGNRAATVGGVYGDAGKKKKAGWKIWSSS